MDIFEVFYKEFFQKTTIFRSHIWRKNQKILGIYYIRKWFLKKVTKENWLVLVLHLYNRKPLFSADAERYSKVVCLNVYVQGTIWIANANCAYFAIIKVCCMQFVVCSLVAWNTMGSWGRIQIEAPKNFFSWMSV